MITHSLYLPDSKTQWQKKETGKFYQEMLEKRRTQEEKNQEA